VRFEPSTQGRGVSASTASLTFIPEGTVIKPLRDRIIVEPIGTVHSRYLIVRGDGSCYRGLVRAVGPGRYRLAYNKPRRYDMHPDDPEKRYYQRTKVWESKLYVPMSVQVGDIVEFGGYSIGGYSFEGFYWGDRYCVHAQEGDVCGIRTDTESAGDGDSNRAHQFAATA
jgi:co-chaperonin GroES (HSP10)